jgi:GTP-binding protein HflX
MPVLISDTVGFIRNLPHDLIASFRSTLGEIRDVDILVKVFDVSSENFLQHIDTVEEALKEMDMPSKASIMVFNKIDAIPSPDILPGLKTRFRDASFISSLNNTGIDMLIAKIQEAITSDFVHGVFQLSFKQTRVLDTIYALTRVLNKKSDYNGISLEVEGTRQSLDKIRQILEK